SNRQIGSAAAQAKTDFLRNQRVITYAGILQANIATLDSERVLVGQMDARTVNAGALESDKRAFAAALNAQRQATFAVQLLGSRSTANVAGNLIDRHQRYFDRISSLVDTIAASQRFTTNLSVGNADDYNRTVVSGAVTDIERFLTAAKSDLGVG